jgi:hypothetical protein
MQGCFRQYIITLIERTRIHRASLTSDACTSITSRGLRFEASQRTADQAVRPPLLGSWTGLGGRPRHAESPGSVLRPKPRNSPPDGFVAKPPNPVCRLRSLAATLHRLDRVQASVISHYLAPARCWFCGQTNRPRTSVVSRYPAPANHEQASGVSRYFASARCWFCGETNKPHTQTSINRYLAMSPCTQLHLALLVSMWPALDPVGHLVSRTKPTCLSTPRMSHRHRPFVLVLHLHQHKPSRNLHLQY